MAEAMKRILQECWKCALGAHTRCHGRWKEGEKEYECNCSICHPEYP